MKNLPHKRDYPRLLYIRDNPWDVKFVRAIKGEPDHILGLCDPENKVIYIKLKQDPENTFKTFIHELIHAFEDEWRFEIPHKTVYKFEDAVMNFVSDNFDVICNMLFSMLGFDRDNLG